MDENKYLHRLCRNIISGRFNWRKYCTPQSYFGLNLCVQPLFCSYGQIGYSVHFPYAVRPMPDLEYDWETGRLLIDEVGWKEYLSDNGD